MRILHVLDHSAPLHSGYTFRTVAILREQHRMGWETWQVTSEKHPAKTLEEDAEGLHFYRTLPSTELWARLPVLGQVAVIRSLERRMRSLVDELRPDVLHAHSPALNGVAAGNVGRSFGIPLVYEMRASWEDAAVDHGTSRPGGARYRLSRALETRVLSRADAVTTICEGLRKEIVSRGIPDAKITTIPNAVDVEQFSVERRRDESLVQELGLSGKTVLGFLGSFYAYEGLALLLEAVSKMAGGRNDLRVLLVGGGPQDEELRALAESLGLGSTVVFTGRVPFATVRSYYDLVDVLVYPRLSMRLTDMVTPLKPLEAMAMGKLVVASDVGGHLELIRDGETGVLFRADDVDDLVAKLGSVLDQSEEASARMCAAGRAFVEHERTWERSVARYREVYEGVLQPSVVHA